MVQEFETRKKRIVVVTDGKKVSEEWATNVASALSMGDYKEFFLVVASFKKTKYPIFHVMKVKYDTGLIEAMCKLRKNLNDPNVEISGEGTDFCPRELLKTVLDSTIF